MSTVEPTLDAGLTGWGAADLPMLIALGGLLVLSGLFSGSETALFGLTEAERMTIRRQDSMAGRMAEALLSHPRMLLITILLGNTTVNVLYFIISSVLMIRSTAGPVGESVMAVAFLLIIVLLGEVGPKVVVNTARVRFTSVLAPAVWTVHRIITPLRLVVDHAVVAPLSRLTEPGESPEQLDDRELRALLEVSDESGVIEPHEHRMLRDVLAMRRLRVRDVMTPRVRMVALPADASRDAVVGATRASRLTKIPVHSGDLDHIVGVLHVKRYLLNQRVRSITDDRVMTPAHFVPDIATLDQLLEHFRRRHVQSAIVVDEYGGTEGIVAVEDVVEELVGDIVALDEEAAPAPRLIGLGRWEVSGDLGVHDWAKAFGLDLPAVKAVTLGGLVTERLGRVAEPGDAVTIDKVVVEVAAVKRGRVISTVVSFRDAGDTGEHPGGGGP